MRKKFKILYNPYFIVPFYLWLIVGFFLLIIFDKNKLLYAINSYNNKAADIFMAFITKLGEATTIIPILLSLFIFKRFRSYWYFTTACLCNLLPFFIQQALKFWFDAPRPMYYFQENDIPLHFNASWQLLYKHSFPSGHCVGAFSLCCFLALLLPDKYKKYGLTLFILAFLVGYSRVYLTAHYFADVYMGSIVGVFITTLAYSITEMVMDKKSIIKK